MKPIVIGEALVDVIPQDNGATRDYPGGSALNTAMALARLGRNPALVTCLAEDERGKLVRDWLAASGVDLVASPPISGRTSSASVALSEDGVASYVFDLSWTPDPYLVNETIANANTLHAGSIASLSDPGAETVAKAMRASYQRALVTYDPNLRPAITPDVDDTRRRVERLVSLAHLVKVSDEDLRWLYPGEDSQSVARRWCAVGPEVVVVTLGAHGALAVTGPDSEPLRIPGLKVQVADTVGAGDTFMGALIDALIGLGVEGPAARSRLATLTNDDLRRALSWATKAAAVTVSRPGANPPTRAELTQITDNSPQSSLVPDVDRLGNPPW